MGYVQGQTIIIDYLTADGQAERYSALAAECVRLGADVIATSTTPATHAAKNTTQAIPIVMIGLGDPVGTGLVDSLARPGGNVTGLSLMAPSLAVKRLELLKELVPQISRVLVLTHLSDPIAAPQVKALEETAHSLLLAANKRLNTAYLLKESFGQLWRNARLGRGASSTTGVPASDGSASSPMNASPT